MSTMTTDYPVSLLKREPAPPFDGEGEFALWHFSEDDSLRVFEPHVPATNAESPALVWAVDTRHSPMFWFPRACPRGCIWAVSTTSDGDVERFFGQSDRRRVHVVESAWPDRMRECRLYAYRLPIGPFKPHDVGGYWVTGETVGALERVTIDGLIGRHSAAGIELRITPSILPFWRRVIESTLEFSGMRLRYAAPHPQQVER